MRAGRAEDPAPVEALVELHQENKSEKSPPDRGSYKYSLPWALIGLRNGN